MTAPTKKTAPVTTRTADARWITIAVEVRPDPNHSNKETTNAVAAITHSARPFTARSINTERSVAPTDNAARMEPTMDHDGFGIGIQGAERILPTAPKALGHTQVDRSVAAGRSGVPALDPGVEAVHPLMEQRSITVSGSDRRRGTPV
jgi:hypothetical protein